jgi:hypothetical protein
MELANPETLEALLAIHGQHRSPPSRLRGQSLYRGYTRTSAPRRCHCGTCFHCVENLRWEKIFNEKFADPSYYSEREIRHCSALSEIGQLGMGSTSK